MRHAHAIATRAAALAIIAGTGLTPLLTPITAHADTTSTQPAADTSDKNGTRAQFTVDKTRVFKYDGTHKTITCLSADYPKEVIFYSQEQTSQPNTDAAANTKLTAADTQTTIDGRTIKGKSYTVTTGTGEKLTLNCYKAGDFFANLKITWNGIQATTNPYWKDGVNDDDTNQYAYSSGTANINTSFTDDQLTDTDDSHLEGIPTGWTAKDKKNTPGDVSSLSPDGINSYTAIYEYTNPEYPGNTYRLYINRVNTPPQPTIQATDAPAPADTPQLVQTGVEQAGAATALLTTFASAAIAAHTIARRKQK